MDLYEQYLYSFVKDVQKKKIEDSLSHVIGTYEYESGIQKMKDLIEFCLVLVSYKYPLSELQFELFMHVLPILIPIIFGSDFYKTNKKGLLKVLHPKHTKLFFSFVGFRRDGKSILQSIIMAAVLCICTRYGEIDKLMPLLGPGEDTGKKMIRNIKTIINLPPIQQKYKDKITMNNSTILLIVTHISTGQKMFAPAYAPTDGKLRGINSWIDFIDETEWIPVVSFQELFIPRYRQEGVPCFSISTINLHSEYYRTLNKNSPVIESIVKSRICPECSEGVTTMEVLKEKMDECLKLGHVEKPNNPWISDKASHWSIYQTKEVYAAEQLGLVLTDKMNQFSNVSLKKFFSQIASIPYNGYEYFFGGFDPSDKGKSETAVFFLGYSNGVFHLLYGNSYRVGDEGRVDILMFEDVRYFIEGCIQNNIISNDLSRAPKTYLFVETFGHHGNNIQDYIEDNRYDNFMKVMKGNNAGKGKYPSQWKYGVPKTKQATEKYVADLRGLITTNRIKISRDFFTRNKDGKKLILDKLKVQMKNFIRNDKGKLTGKSNKYNDDCVCALMMIPTNANNCFLAQHPFSSQFSFGDGQYTF